MVHKYEIVREKNLSRYLQQKKNRISNINLYWIYKMKNCRPISLVRKYCHNENVMHVKILNYNQLRLRFTTHNIIVITIYKLWVFNKTSSILFCYYLEHVIHIFNAMKFIIGFFNFHKYLRAKYFLYFPFVFDLSRIISKNVDITRNNIVTDKIYMTENL